MNLGPRLKITINHSNNPRFRSRVTDSTINNMPTGSSNHSGSPAPSPIGLQKPARVGSVIYAGKEPRYSEDGIRVERAVDVVIDGEELEG